MIHQKRETWWYTDARSKKAFTSKEEAEEFAGVSSGTKKEIFIEEKAGTDEQDFVFESEIGGEEEI